MSPDPGMVVDLSMLHFSGGPGALVEQEKHVFVGIAMEGDVEDVADLDRDAALLGTLPNDGVLWKLALLQLAAGELPQACEVGALASLSKQDAAVSHHHRCCDDHRHRCGLREAPSGCNSGLAIVFAKHIERLDRKLGNPTELGPILPA